MLIQTDLNSEMFQGQTVNTISD